MVAFDVLKEIPWN